MKVNSQVWLRIQWKRNRIAEQTIRGLHDSPTWYGAGQRPQGNFVLAETLLCAQTGGMTCYIQLAGAVVLNRSHLGPQGTFSSVCRHVPLSHW